MDFSDNCQSNAVRFHITKLLPICLQL
uniref:Uncharacterized protein n=1 Tax=Anguilla anguilla TaxID=7936 RepID=A0A0E9T216_ANGAN